MRVENFSSIPGFHKVVAILVIWGAIIKNGQNEGVGQFKNFKSYTKYSWIADEKQKKIIDVLNDSFLSSLVWGGSLIKSFGNLGL